MSDLFQNHAAKSGPVECPQADVPERRSSPRALPEAACREAQRSRIFENRWFHQGLIRTFCLSDPPTIRYFALTRFFKTLLSTLDVHIRPKRNILGRHSWQMFP